VAYQSLYRRYRSQKFSEVVGQGHVTSALRTAVAENRYGHAYLFSGPRGTGKTSTARILAKALNCPDVADGEPCGVCDSCQAIEQGTSFDLHELDAASHNKVDDIRDLISKVHLGSPGRTKVYILDEVHMLSSGAENALLKTLEEPPDHVVFVLATTEPHKVVPTIRSRTQHFEFRLLPADDLGEHVRWVIGDAGLDVGDDAVDYVLTQGGGSARDTLSALDLVAAAGGVPAGSDVGVELTKALGDGDPAAAIAAVQEGLTAGQEPRTIGEATVEVLRNAFLAAMGAPLHHLNDRTAETAKELGGSLGPATVTKALEALGQALVEMRQAPDPRVPLEVAVIRLCHGPAPAAPAAATSPAPAAPAPSAAPAATSTGGSTVAAPTDEALLTRVAQLEAQVRDLTARLDAGAAAAPAGGAANQAEAAADDAKAGGPAAAARNRLAEVTAKPPPSPRARRGDTTDTTDQAAAPTPAEAPAAAEAPGAADTSGGSAPSTSAAPTAPAQDQPQSPAPGGSEPAEPATATQPAATAAPSTGPDTGSESAAPGAEAGAEPAPSGERPALSSALTQSAVEAAFETCLDEVSQKTRVRFKGGRILGVEGTSVIFGVPNDIHRTRCIDLKGEVEQSLGTHFGQSVTVEIRVDGDAPAPTMDPAKIEPAPKPTAEADEDIGPVEELADATDQSANGVDRLTKAFPGSKVIDHQDGEPGQ